MVITDPKATKRVLDLLNNIGAKTKQRKKRVRKLKLLAFGVLFIAGVVGVGFLAKNVYSYRGIEIRKNWDLKSVFPSQNGAFKDLKQKQTDMRFVQQVLGIVQVQFAIQGFELPRNLSIKYLTLVENLRNGNDGWAGCSESPGLISCEVWIKQKDSCPVNSRWVSATIWVFMSIFQRYGEVPSGFVVEEVYKNTIVALNRDFCA